jgi:thymidylate synthase (FAD)
VEAGTYPGGRSADAAHEIERVSSPALDGLLGHSFPVLDHGFIRVIDYMGDESSVVQAARVSYGAGTKEVSEDRRLLRYLMRHRHSTPFEMCELKLHVKLPIFVARQWIRHRTANVNEYSARYSILDREFYVPAAEDLAPQSTTNKQGRAGSYSDDDRRELQRSIVSAANYGFDSYDSMISPVEKGGPDLSREIARIVTPMSTYTQWYWKVDLHNLLHFLSLRADPHAQKEIRVYAEVILDLVKAWVPNIAEAFEDYRLGARTFSRQELAILRQMATGYQLTTGSHVVGQLAKSERADFLRALGLPEEPV